MVTVLILENNGKSEEFVVRTQQYVTSLYICIYTPEGNIPIQSYSKKKEVEYHLGIRKTNKWDREKSSVIKEENIDGT